MVTNLDANGVQRALKSLTAELDHRMKVLQDAKAKDLMELEKRWDTTAPPSLVIVVDEFAALVQEVPEFVDGVVNVAQRGRSLGLHLILATQRPAGVIKDNLRANTNLRMALRVADEADSSDVLGVPDAAFFDPDLPGRAVSKTGAGRLLPFQTAYVGGRTGQGPSRPDVRVESLDLSGSVGWEIPEAVGAPAVTPSGPSDIARIVETINRASREAALPTPRRPWLPDLRGTYDIRDLTAGHLAGNAFAMGMADLPESQAQQPFAFEPDQTGNLAVFGASGSGKSTALRTLAVCAGLSFRYGPTWVYGLDFGAQGLAMLEGFPHVGAIIRGNDDERVRRLLTWLGGLVDERARRYAAANAGSVTQYRAVAGRTDEPRILVLLDGLAGFLKAYETNDVWIDRLVSIASAGRPVGVHLVVSADRSGALPTSLGATIQRRLVLRMTSIDEYDNCGVPRTILTPESAPGRGIWDGHEVQVGVLGTSPDLGEQARAMAELSGLMRQAGAPVAAEIKRLPEMVPLSSLPTAARGEITIGLRDDTLGVLTIPSDGTVAVTGPPGSGRTTALHSIAAGARAAYPGVKLVLLTPDRRSPLLGLPLWTRSSVGTEGAGALADELTSTLELPGAEPLVVVVEKLAEWSDSPSEYSIESLMKAVVRAGGLVVSDADASVFGRSYGLGATANAARVGFLLQPDGGEGSAFGADLPRRLNRAEFPSGRGFFVRGGRALLAQLAFPS